jgi:hypothetical protein
MIRFTGRRSKAGAVAVTAAATLGTLVLCGAGGTAHHTAMRATLSDSVCSPSGVLPVTVGGILPAPGYCPGAPGGSAPQVPAGQQGQQCQLTEAQQQELVARAQDQQAASDLLFQSSLLKNLLAQAALKAGSAALSAQLSGKTGLSPQDVANLIQNGSVTPADMATAILQTLQELGESSGDTAIDTCAGIQNADNIAANSSGDPQTGGSNQGGDQGASVAPGTNVPADPLAAAADPYVDLSKVTPTDIVWRTDNDTLYRVDDQTPDQVFANGFQPLDVNGDYDLNDKVGLNDPSPYVSTTRYADYAGRSPYFYKIEAPGGIDLEASPGVGANVGEGEVVFPGGIASRYIVGAWEYDANDVQGTWIPNPNFGK